MLVQSILQLERLLCHVASRQQQRYGKHLIALEQICGFIRHLIKIWRLGSDFLAVKMLRPFASSANAARLPDQKEHACEIRQLKEQRTSQRRDNYCADGMRSEVDSQCGAAQHQPQDATKDF
ncbi:hypothetical protein X736_30970 [Mesorhizobium sp. L2C089B000]|nr:hypothetical protein X736_30970 [Mesorhizobium sp. L2C089B000]